MNAIETRLMSAPFTESAKEFIMDKIINAPEDSRIMLKAKKSYMEPEMFHFSQAALAKIDNELIKYEMIDELIIPWCQENKIGEKITKTDVFDCLISNLGVKQRQLME
jgi:nucleoid-associated protein YejK